MGATTGDAALFQALNNVPCVDIATNLAAALEAGRHVPTLLNEMIVLRCGQGRLTPQEYFYYRLWDPILPVAEKRRFVGKHVQNRMHVAVNDRHWFQTSADKILWHGVMAGAGLPAPEVLAITQSRRRLPGIQTLTSGEAVASFLRSQPSA